MASFNIRFKPSVEKDFRRLPKKLVPRVLERIENLKDEPFPHG
jgi:mRNA-degrading endonuclease RelE of RelBE toxin-antitoxin system